MKKKIFSYFILLIFCIAVLSSCTMQNESKTESTSGSATSEVKTSVEFKEVSAEYDKEDYYFDWKSSEHKTINLESDNTEITKSRVYELTGTLKDGSIVVNVDKDSDKGVVYLVLNNANITSKTSAPIYIKDAKKVVLLLENDTTNSITQGTECEQDESGNPSAAVFSKADLTITGGGTLKVTSDFNDGITSKDDLKITDGVIEINAKADGITGKDLLAVEKADIKITAGKDGMRSTNETEVGKGNVVISDGTFNINSANDSIQAYAILQINGGIFNLSSGGGYTGSSIKANMGGGFGGMKGERPGRPGEQTQQDTSSSESSETEETESTSKKALKADRGIFIKGGDINISSYEDAVHSNGNVEINGGNFVIDCGDDGIHSDNSLTINNGTIEIKNSYEGIEGKNITVNDGKVTVKASDDGFNVNDSKGALTINNGEITVSADGDGLDSNGSIKMTGGTVYVEGPTNDGNGALDYDSEYIITGGTLFASGSSGMAQAPSTNSEQNSVLMYYSSAQAAGTTVTLKDKSGKVIATYKPQKQYASVVISSPEIKKGTTYTLYSEDKEIVSFEISETTTFVNESGVTTNQSNIPGGGMNKGGQGGQNGMTPPDGQSGMTPPDGQSGATPPDGQFKKEKGSFGDFGTTTYDDSSSKSN